MATVRTVQYFLDLFQPGYALKAVDMEDLAASIPTLGATSLASVNSAISGLTTGLSTANTAISDLQDQIDALPTAGGVLVNYITQTGPLTLAPFTNEEQVDGYYRIDVVTGSGNPAHTITVNGRQDGITPDPTKRNIIRREWVAGNVTISIQKETIPDTSPLTLSSAITNTAGDLITVTVNKDVYSHTLVFKKNNVVISGTASIEDNTILFVPTVAILTSDTVVANGTVTDIFGIDLTLEPNEEVENLVAAGSQFSLVGSALATAVNPANMSFNPSGSAETTGTYVFGFKNLVAEAHSVFSTSIPFNNWLYIEANGSISFSLFNGGNQRGVVTAAGQLPLNTWKHVAIVYTGSVIKIFVDGVEVTTTENLGGTYTLQSSFSASTRFNIAEGTYKIYRLRFFRDALNSTQINQLKNTGATTVTPTSDYPFENNTEDIGANGYDLTGTGTFSSDHPTL